MIQPIEVVGAIIVRDSTVLAARRGPSKSLKGMWEFPGGKVECDEDPREALGREIREELSCEIEVGTRVATTSHAYDFGLIRLSTYYATLTAGQPTAIEHAELRWVAIRNLSALNWAPADIPTVRKLMSRAPESG